MKSPLILFEVMSPDPVVILIDPDSSDSTCTEFFPRIFAESTSETSNEIRYAKLKFLLEKLFSYHT